METKKDFLWCIVTKRRLKQMCSNASTGGKVLNIYVDIVTSYVTWLHVFLFQIQTRLNEINVYTEVLSRKISDQERERLKIALGCSEDDYWYGSSLFSNY